MPKVVVIGSELNPDGAGDCLGRFEGYWTQRGSELPTIEYRTFEQALAAESREAAGWDAALVCASADRTDAELFRLLSQLEETTTPGLVLDGTHGRRRDSLSTDAIFAYVDEPPEAAAAMLFALVKRQHSVRSMTQGLATAHSMQHEAAVEIDRLHDEMLLAAQVQRELLPKQLPELPGLSIGVLFRPAGFVSGDIYDVDQLDEHTIGFFLADAMGHGVPAALMTLFISASLPQKEVKGSNYKLITPSESLSRLNAHMCASRVGSTRFATAVCGLIEFQTGKVTIASAGHPAALRIRGERCRAVELSGPLLGVFDDGEFEETSFTLERDELLVLHSDGLEEAYAPRQLAGESNGNLQTRHLQALAKLGTRARGEHASETLERLAQDLDSQAGSFHQGDDVSVLAFARV